MQPYCLLPDTICGECVENIDNFHAFIKHCLQNTIILEAQYNVQESCLKSKQKRDKGCLADFEHEKMTRGMQTEDFLDVITGNHANFEEYCKSFPLTTNFLQNSKNEFRLVNYDTDSDSASDHENMGKVFLSNSKILNDRAESLFSSAISEERLFLKRKYFNDSENNLISEISQRKRLRKDDIKHCQPKMCKLDATNRRKSKIPKKLDTQVAVFNLHGFGDTSKEHNANAFGYEFNTEKDSFSQVNKANITFYLFKSKTKFIFRTINPYLKIVFCVILLSLVQRL